MTRDDLRPGRSLPRGYRPTYVEEKGAARYFLRTGNATRELDVREALAHVERRFGSAAAPPGRTIEA